MGTIRLMVAMSGCECALVLIDSDLACRAILFQFSEKSFAVTTTLTLDFLRCSLDRMVALAKGFGDVEHDGVKGVLRESLIESFLEPLLMPPYQAGTGVIIDSKGNQSGQCDIVIWDESIFRPFYSARGAGIYFIESVVAVIEVKSRLVRDSVRQAIQRTREFKEMMILRPGLHDNNQFWGAAPGILPLSFLFGFRSDIVGSEGDRANGIAAEENIALDEYLQLICVPGKDSWAFQAGKAVPYIADVRYPYNEVLMPFSGLLNSLKDVSSKRGRPNLGFHLVPYQIEEILGK